MYSKVKIKNKFMLCTLVLWIIESPTHLLVNEIQ